MLLKYHKVPKLSPWAYTSQIPFSVGLYTMGLISGGGGGGGA